MDDLSDKLLPCVGGVIVKGRCLAFGDFFRGLLQSMPRGAEDASVGQNGGTERDKGDRAVQRGC